MTDLPVSNVINVTITNTPSGLTERNVNSLALFTTEEPTSLAEYGVYVSAQQVATDYGTSSVTAAMANAIFAQSPNIRTGTGRLVIIPMGADDSAVATASATAGDIETPDISSNLASILLVEDGDIRITINGINYDLTGLNFSASTTWAQVAAVIQAKLLEGVVTALENGIKVTSKKVGTDSTVALAANPASAGTDVSGAGYFNASGSTATAGSDAVGETLLEAIARIENQVGFTGVITNLDMEDSVLEATSDAIQAQDRLWVHHLASTQDIAGVATTISDSSNTKTRLVLYTDSISEANLAKSAYAGRAFSTNFSGSNTSATMNLKSLATITPDAGITQTLFTEADTAGVDLYVSYEGVASVLSSGGNNFFDNVYTDLALKFALEVAGFNFLRQTNTKIPQTEAGMDGLKNSYAQVLERYITNGAIAAGSWTSSEKFGDPEIFDQNILDRGYYVYSLPIVQQAANEREAREAPLVQIAIKRAGAIHTSDVLVLVND